MNLHIYQVDAFAEKVFQGNPAAICPLDEWLPDSTLQKIAQENNLSETAFFVETDSCFHLRWFTPVAEVKLCGHATLASAHVLFEELNHSQEEINFQTLSGQLVVSRNQNGLTMNFPVLNASSCNASDTLIEAMGKMPLEAYKGEDYLLVYESENDILSLSPDMNALAKIDCRGVCVTARGYNVDFVSRFFAPSHGINEDPVTGSAHCLLTPYWKDKLKKNKLVARQLSQRGGNVECELIGDRVYLTGRAVTYLQGEINI